MNYRGNSSGGVLLQRVVVNWSLTPGTEQYTGDKNPENRIR